MIWLFLLGVVLYIITTPSKEDDAMAWVGKEELEKARRTMSEKEFKNYVQEKAILMKKAENDAAKYYRNNK